MTIQQLLNDTLKIYREIEELQTQINELHRIAENIFDDIEPYDDDYEEAKEYIDCIKSYTKTG